MKGKGINYFLSLGGLIENQEPAHQRRGAQEKPTVLCKWPLWRGVMEPIIYWPSVFNKEDIKHAFMLSSKRKPGHEQRLSLFPGFPGYSHDTFHTFLNTLVPRVFFSYTNFRHWSIGYQLRGGITHKHSDITRVVTAMNGWSHWHCLICFRLGLCHADSLFQVLRYWGMTRKCNEHAKM